MEKKPQRNDPCPCDSGKKFKKCCQGKMTAKFSASKIETSALSSLTNQLFQGKVTKVSPVKEQPMFPENPHGTFQPIS